MSCIYSILSNLAPYDSNFYIEEDFPHFTFEAEKLANCKHLCCDHLIIVINGLGELERNYSESSQFHMYFFINMKPGEDPNTISVKLENLIIFQVMESATELFTVYERKRKGMKRVYIWDGNYFLDNRNKKYQFPHRNYQGEIVRVASGPIMPMAFILTRPDGSQIAGNGAYLDYIRVIAIRDGLRVTYVDVLYEEGILWGTLYKNGTSTGMVKLILEHRADLTLPILCGVRIHRNLACSTSVEFDGFSAFRLKPEPFPTWQGLLLPFDLPTWFAILGSVMVTTVILAFCTKYSLNKDKMDWPLHFLDAFHPMCGRNMAVPGFNAAHLGRE